MIELAKGVYHVAGKNKSRFPYCSCLYLKGKKLRVLIDAGMGADNIPEVMEAGVDVLILSHCHIDHRLTRRLIMDAPVWCHELEVPYLADRQNYFSSIGIFRGGFKEQDLFKSIPNGFDMDVSRTLRDGETLDLGGMTLEIIHTPGHTPGHLAFYIPESNFIFSADVDLTSFGPYYGHDFADIEAFIYSIDKLRKIRPEIVLTGHAGPFTDSITERFNKFESVIYNRDELLLRHLDRPRSMDYFKRKKIIYPGYPEKAKLIHWFEHVHITKQLERLERLGKAKRIDDLWLQA